MSEHRERTKLSPIDENARKAGPAQPTGPAQEQIVIRDKRKIDGTGRPKTAEPGASGGEAGSTPVPEAQQSGADGTATMGKPGTSTDQVSPAGPDGVTAGSGRRSATRSAEPAQAAKPGPVEARKPGPATGPAAGPAGPADRTTIAEPGAQPGVARAEATPEAKPEAKPEAGAAEAGGEVAEGGQPVPAALGAELAALRSELDERLRDLQRVTAEYANYRKRVERDRGAMAEQAFATVLLALLPILDDLDRARDHGDLVGPFGAVAEQLTTALGKFGLTGFGEVGDAFDPTRHEAVTHQRSADVSEPTCVEVMRRGFMLGDRLLRAALVSVADPE